MQDFMAELKAMPIWFHWHWEQDKNGRQTKVPHAARGGATGTSEQWAHTWVTYGKRKKRVPWTSILVVGLLSPNLTEPEITSGEFPFVIEYEFEGETYIVEDTVVCSYEGNDPSAWVPTRSYSYDLKNDSNRLMIEFDANTESLLTEGQINEESRIVWYYGHGGYYLGDPKKTDRGPCINYVEIYNTSPKVSHHQTTKLTNEQLEELFGIKIIRFEFSSPIENTFE